MQDFSLKDLFEVGPDKPMGYLPIRTIKKRGWTPAKVLAWAASAGLETAVLAEDKCHVVSGAIYVWDAQAVQRLLDLNVDITQASGWPQVADQFVEAVATRFADGPAIYDLVGAMFRDARMAQSEWVKRT